MISLLQIQLLGLGFALYEVIGMSVSPSIVWFRQDLRLRDNPALRAAIQRGGPVVPVFVWAPEEEGDWAPGSASRWWLHHSLRSFNDELNEVGSRLIIRHGGSFRQLETLINEAGAEAVFWNRRYEPSVVRRDKDIKAVLQEQGIVTESFNGCLLYEPWEVATKQGKPYQVFTPYWKACRALGEPAEPLSEPRKLRLPDRWPKSEPLESLALEPAIDWAAGIKESWQPGTTGAQTQLRRFLNQTVGDYKQQREIPGEVGTSRLSPHLHFGEISPRQIWHAVKNKCGFETDSAEAASVETFLTELGWREFAHHVLFHFPQTPDRPLRSKFESFPWADDRDALRAWQRGRTGYPIVDAGMRELWATGWMHNRVRMIVGSFLTKDLLLSWQEGARWFWDTLVDADLANNTLGWQWVSGCGADAAPYFRVFNPISQGEKFDADGTYVRRWVPELKDVPTRWIHQPWNAPAEVLETAGVEQGTTYPQSVVDHAAARKVALDAFASIKSR
jgi:deoxyribodipyrimidine photo-lyase